MSFTLGVHQSNTHINIRVLYFILVVSSVHTIVQTKITAFLQYFCHNVLHSSCLVDTVHSTQWPIQGMAGIARAMGATLMGAQKFLDNNQNL